MDANRQFLSEPFFGKMSSLKSNTTVMLIILQFVDKYKANLQLQQSELDSLNAAMKKMSNIKSLISAA